MSRITVKFPYSDDHTYAYFPDEKKWEMVKCDCNETAPRCNAAQSFDRGSLNEATTRQISYERYLSIISESAILDI